MALADGFDIGFMIKYDLQLLTGNVIPLSIMTDSLSLFDVITKATVTTEKRLMMDLNAVKEAYQKHDIMIIGFIRSQFNPADALTKKMTSHILDHMLLHSKIENPIEQWIERPRATKEKSRNVKTDNGDEP